MIIGFLIRIALVLWIALVMIAILTILSLAIYGVSCLFIY